MCAAQNQRLVTSFSGLFPSAAGGSSSRNSSSEPLSQQFLVFGEPEMDAMELSGDEYQTHYQPTHQSMQQQQQQLGGGSGRRQRRNSQQQRPHHKGPLFGISPSFGAAPIEGLLWTKDNTLDEPKKLAPSSEASRRRRRHCSLEEEHLDESSSSSHGSCEQQQKLQQQQQELKKKNSDELHNPVKSFINGSGSFLPFTPTTNPAPAVDNAPAPLSETSNDGALDSDLDAPFGLDVVCDPHLLLLRSTLVTEFELRLRGLVESRASEFQLEFPEGLLAVIASHVLQEAEMEPYGLKGCVLRLQYEGQTALHTIGTMHCGNDAAVGSPDIDDVDGAAVPTPTFGITVTLRQAQVSWGQRMARRLSFSSSPPILSVSTSYKLVKNRAYRPHEQLLESEFRMMGK